MILHGNQRGGGRNLALHLLKPENDHVELHSIRGFVSDNLVDAFKESHAISRGTKARQHLYSLSLNPPRDADVPTETFIDAVERAEIALGLESQPRAIVFHEKRGSDGVSRRHAHAVWSRVDGQTMKAIQISFPKRKLKALSQALYLENGWEMPAGFGDPRLSDPRNYTMAQWQQAKRAGKNPKLIKAVFQGAWKGSDTQEAFERALKSRGYFLARGDRRGFVALDHRCEVYSVAKWCGVKAREVREKLDNPDQLPGVTEAKVQFAQQMRNRLHELSEQHNSAVFARLSDLARRRECLVNAQRRERKGLVQSQAERKAQETAFRQARYHRGLRGWWDRLCGQHKRIAARNAAETAAGEHRDQRERDAMIHRQVESRQSLEARMARLKGYHHSRIESLERDMRDYRDIQAGLRETMGEPPKPGPLLELGPGWSL